MGKKRNLGGRPPRGKRAQASRLYVRADDDEKARFEQAAENAGQTLSEWIRDRLNRAAKRELS